MNSISRGELPGGGDSCGRAEEARARVSSTRRKVRRTGVGRWAVERSAAGSDAPPPRRMTSACAGSDAAARSPAVENEAVLNAAVLNDALLNAELRPDAAGPPAGGDSETRFD